MSSWPRLVTGATPILIDEWQRVPEVWNIIRSNGRRGPPADPHDAPAPSSGVGLPAPYDLEIGARRRVDLGLLEHRPKVGYACGPLRFGPESPEFLPQTVIVMALFHGDPPPTSSSERNAFSFFFPRS